MQSSSGVECWRRRNGIDAPCCFGSRSCKQSLLTSGRARVLLSEHASFTLLLPLLQSAASTQRAAAGARLAAEQCPRDMNSAFRSMRVKRPSPSMIEWRPHQGRRESGDHKVVFRGPRSEVWWQIDHNLGTRVLPVVLFDPSPTAIICRIGCSCCFPRWFRRRVCFASCNRRPQSFSPVAGA